MCFPIGRFAFYMVFFQYELAELLQVLLHRTLEIKFD